MQPSTEAGCHKALALGEFFTDNADNQHSLLLLFSFIQAVWLLFFFLKKKKGDLIVASGRRAPDLSKCLVVASNI